MGENPKPEGTHPEASRFYALRGAAKDVFRQFGGGEALRSQERERFDGDREAPSPEPHVR